MFLTMKIFLPCTIFAVFAMSAQNCSERTDSGTLPKATPAASTPVYPTSRSDDFAAYWYAGVAELCSYDVVQERYGEMRQAEQVNIFVTEDLSFSKQVKLDDPANAGSDRVPVLKLNSVRRFHTGIYDYSIMQSVFTPIDGKPTLKISTSVQDWCGQVFLQQNLTESGYRQRGFSYFETEGDQDTQLPLALLEDEIWTRLRLDPTSLPTGKLNVIPSALYARLKHKPNQAQQAEINIEQEGQESLLKLRYSGLDRSLLIRFETKSPHKILGWEELSGGKTVSKGTLKALRKSAYWGEHDNVHAPLRDSLQLQF